MTVETARGAVGPPESPVRWLDALWHSVARKPVREHEWGVILLAGVLGVAAGLGVAILRLAVTRFQYSAFGVSDLGYRDDGEPYIWWRVLFIPALGGVLVGVVAWLIRRRRPHDIIDAVEANALFGGRMSLIDSINLAITTILSCGVGASVGLEAAYTQLGAGLSSRVGRLLRLRRDDLRTLVGCGAGAAIAAAFNAPMAGAFYAFELVIGSYSLSVLAPVAIASLAGVIAVRTTFGAEASFVVDRTVRLVPIDYPLFLLLGFVCALLSIVVMRGVTATERWFAERSIPKFLRPAIGGAALGVMALIYPETLGSGHGGIIASLRLDYSLPYLGGLLAAKIAASAISIGAGFRGGLFSSSLFLGSLTGSAFGLVAARLLPATDLDPLAFTLVGMGSIGTGIVGAPVAMLLLVQESTGDFSATSAVMVGVIITSVSVRHWFGYSFGTWRFHLRGLKIRGAEDVSWLDALTVADMLRTDPKTVQADMTVAQIRETIPVGSTKRLVVLHGDRLVGAIDLAELHSPDFAAGAADQPVSAFLPPSPAFLLPQHDIREALDRFATTELEMLPVVSDSRSLTFMGYLSEAYALRRYNQELERRRGQALDDSSLYSPAV